MERKRGGMMDDARFIVTVDGYRFAGAEGPRDQALREAMHYASCYVADGEPRVEVWEKPKRGAAVRVWADAWGGGGE